MCIAASPLPDSAGSLLRHLGPNQKRKLVLSGHGVVLYEDGNRPDLLPGQAFYITATPHDSWVEGGEPYVSLHILASPPGWLGK